MSADQYEIVFSFAVAGRSSPVGRIGAAAPIIRDHLEGAVLLVDAGTLGDAVAFAHKEAESGDVVLLAPACASFDQFENYEHRGRVFKQLVKELS